VEALTRSTDLGTTNFRVAVYNDRRLRVETIVDDWGNHAVPAWISFGEAEVLIGPSAKAAFSANPKNIVFDIMKLIGRNMDDAGIIDGNEKWAFEAISETGALSVGVEFRREPQNFTPVKLLAMLLGKAKETAQAYLGEEVTNAVVAVPTCSDFLFLQKVHALNPAQILLPLSYRRSTTLGLSRSSTSYAQSASQCLLPLPMVST
jgi:molecular chaperone DnaK (HSP70)